MNTSARLIPYSADSAKSIIDRYIAINGSWKSAFGSEVVFEKYLMLNEDWFYSPPTHEPDVFYFGSYFCLTSGADNTVLRLNDGQGFEKTTFNPNNANLFPMPYPYLMFNKVAPPSSYPGRFIGYKFRIKPLGLVHQATITTSGDDVNFYFEVESASSGIVVVDWGDGEKQNVYITNSGLYGYDFSILRTYASAAKRDIKVYSRAPFSKFRVHVAAGYDTISNIDLVYYNDMDTFVAGSQKISSDNVDRILIGINNTSTTPGYIELASQSPSAPPSSQGSAAASQLTTDGWLVNTD